MEYDFDATAKTLTITVKAGGVVVDTKTLAEKDLPTGPSLVPHPGPDLRFGTADDIDPSEECCCSSEVSDFDDPVERVFVVNSAADDDDGLSGDDRCDTGGGSRPLTGVCTLRAALTETDATPGVDMILFDIPASDVPTIRPEVITRLKGPLGALHPVIVDGTSQPAGLVELDGSLTAFDSDPAALDPVGLELVGERSIVQGLVINRFASDGIRVRPSGAPASLGNLIIGNRIGTDVTGTVPLPNGGAGVRIVDMPNNAIVNNVIAASREDGVSIEGAERKALGNEISGNFIGRDETGQVALGNAGAGVFVEAGATGNSLNANPTAFNAGLGIELAEGANNDRTAPVLEMAGSDGIVTTVQGFIVAGPPATLTLDFFASQACDPSGSGEGESYLGSAKLSTEDGAAMPFVVRLTGAGGNVTATATDADGNTSAFSRCVPVGSLTSGDLNGDGGVDCADLAIVRSAFGRRTGQPGFDPRTDVHADGVVDIRDLARVARQLSAGTRCPPG